MIARIGALGALLVTAALLETVVFSALAVAGHAPMIIALTVVGIALVDGPETGGMYGFVAGLAIDLLGGGLVGLSALVLLLVGFGVGVLRPYLTGPPLGIHVVVGGLAVAAGSTLFGILLFLLEPADLTWSALVQGTLITTLYSAALAPFVIRATIALSQRVEAQTVR